LLMPLVLSDILFCDPKTRSVQIRIQPDLSSKMRPGPAPVRFETVKSGTSLVTVIILFNANRSVVADLCTV